MTADTRPSWQEPACQSRDSSGRTHGAQGQPQQHRVPRTDPCQAVSQARLPLAHLPLGNLQHQLLPTPRKPGFSGLDISAAKESKQSLPPRLALRQPLFSSCNKTQTAKPVQLIKRTSQTNGMPLLCIVSQVKSTTESMYFYIKQNLNSFL